MLIDRDRVAALAGEDAPNASEYAKLGRVGRVHLLEDKKAGALHELPGPRILVIANSTQWYWLSYRWLGSFARRIGEATTPILLRAKPEGLKDESIISAVDAVYYLDDESLAADLDSLKRISASSKRVLTTRKVPGLESETLGARTVDWRRLMEGIERPARVTRIHRTDGAKTPARFKFDVDASAPSLVLLAMHHFSNWNAAVDGRRTPVFAAGPDAVAALVPKGEHKLVFTFEQTAVERATGWITAAGWLFVVVAGAWTIAQRVRKRKSEKRESGN